MTARILVVGANGRVGREVVARLLDGGREVRALVREAPRAEALERPGVEVVTGDLMRPETLPVAVAGIERAYYATDDPANTVAMLEAFLEAARAGGVRHVVRLSARSADAGSKDALPRRHGLAEQALEASGLAWTHLRPSWFMQMMFEYAPGGVIELPAGDGRICWVDVRDIAEVAALALTQDGHEGRMYELSGPAALDHGEMAAIMSQATGRRFVYRDIAPEAHRARLVAAGEDAWYVDLLLELYANIRRDAYATPADGYRQATSKAPTGFDRFCRDHVAELVRQL